MRDERAPEGLDGILARAELLGAGRSEHGRSLSFSFVCGPRRFDLHLRKDEFELASIADRPFAPSSGPLSGGHSGVTLEAVSTPILSGFFPQRTARFDPERMEPDAGSFAAVLRSLVQAAAEPEAGPGLLAARALERAGDMAADDNDPTFGRHLVFRAMAGSPFSIPYDRGEGDEEHGPAGRADALVRAALDIHAPMSWTIENAGNGGLMVNPATFDKILRGGSKPSAHERLEVEASAKAILRRAKIRT